MCRWLTYCGDPVFIDKLVIQPDHSLLAQSMNTRMNFHPDGSLWATNADGFGLGWYDRKPEPGQYRDTYPAWNDVNLKEITAQVESHLFMAHVRATTTGGVQRTNCHPFKHKNWLFQHNGHIDNFENIRQELQSEIAPDIFHSLKGTTDSETFFLLAMTYGLENDAHGALKKAVERVEKAMADDGNKGEFQLSCAVTDGKTIYTVRYGNKGQLKTQFYSTDLSCIDDLQANRKDFGNGVIVVSEPLEDLTNDMWVEVPPASFMTIQNGNVQVTEF